MELTWKITGAGHPVFLLHGFGEDNRVWMQVAMGLEGPFRLLMPDWPGFGETPFQPFDLEQLAHAVALKIKENAQGKALVLGHSMGGYVTLALAAHYPELLAGWGLIHSTPLADSAEKKANREKSIAFINQHGRKPYLDTLIPGLFAPQHRQAAFVERTREIAETSTEAGLCEALRAMMARPERKEVLANSQVPVLLVNGTYDELIPVQQLYEWGSLTPHAQLTLLEDSGHMGLIEQPFVLRDAIFEFGMRCFKPVTDGSAR